MPFDPTRIYSSEVGPPGELRNGIIRSWNMLAFAKTLRGLRETSHWWNESISEHPWWRLEIIKLVEESDVARAQKTRRNHPTGAGRAPRATTSSHDHKMSLLCAAHQRCFLCILELPLYAVGEGKIGGRDAKSQTPTLLLGEGVPRCEEDHGKAYCCNCLRKDDWSEHGTDDGVEDLPLVRFTDYNSWGHTLVDMCRPCAQERITQMAIRFNIFDIVNGMGIRSTGPPVLARMFAFAHMCDYRRFGMGRLEFIFKNFVCYEWLDRMVDLTSAAVGELVAKREEKKLKLRARHGEIMMLPNSTQGEQARRKAKLASVAKQWHAVEDTTVLEQTDWDAIIDEQSYVVSRDKVATGMWLSPEEELAVKGPKVVDERLELLRTTLTPMSQYVVTLPRTAANLAPDKANRYPLKANHRNGPAPPAMTHDVLMPMYVTSLAAALKPALMSTFFMLCETSLGPNKVWRIEKEDEVHEVASKLTPVDLVEWLRDPRIHYEGWWAESYDLELETVAPKKRKRDAALEPGDPNDEVDEIREEPNKSESPDLSTLSTGDVCMEVASIAQAVAPSITLGTRRASSSFIPTTTAMGGNKRRRISGEGQAAAQERQADAGDASVLSEAKASPDSIASSISDISSSATSNVTGTDTPATSATAHSAGLPATSSSRRTRTAHQLPHQRRQPRTALSASDRLRLSIRPLPKIEHRLDCIPAVGTAIAPAAQEIIGDIWRDIISTQIPCKCTICIRHQAHWGAKKREEGKAAPAKAPPLELSLELRILATEALMHSARQGSSGIVTLPPNHTRVILIEGDGSDGDLDDYEDDSDTNAAAGRQRTPECEEFDEDEELEEEFAEDDDVGMDELAHEEPPAGDEV